MSAADDLLRLRKDLVAARLRQGLSQRSVADRLGLTRQAVSAWENGPNFPPSDKLFFWAAAVGIRIVSQSPEVSAATVHCTNQATEIAA